MIIGISRLERVSGVTGSGTLCSLALRSKKYGKAKVGLENISLTDSKKDNYIPAIKGSSIDILPAKLEFALPKTDFIYKNNGFNAVITITEIASLYGAAFDVLFNPAVLEVATVTDGGFLGKDGGSTQFLSKVDGGTLTVGITRMGEPTMVSGYYGELCKITFYATTTGTSALSFANVSLTDIGLNQIGSRDGTGSVTVITPPAAGPIAGMVSRADTPTPISEAVVELSRSGRRLTSVKTNPDGSYLLPDLYAGTYEIKASSADCGLALTTQIKLAPGESRDNLNFSLGNEVIVSRSRSVVEKTDGTRLSFDENSFSEDVKVSISSSLEPFLLPPSALSPVALREIGCLKANGEPYQGRFNKLVTVEIPYSDTAGVNPADLRVFRLNSTERVWRLVNEGGVNEVDVSRKVVKAEVNAFSVFGLIPLSQAANIGPNNIVVYPNPVMVSQGQNRVFFKDLPAQATVKIYNLAGELVASPSGATWNLTDKIAGGIYIYLVAGDGWEKTGKIGVVR